MAADRRAASVLERGRLAGDLTRNGRILDLMAIRIRGI